MAKEKCSEPLCKREAQIFIARRDKMKREHLYCSAFCAQADSVRRDNVTESAKTARSSLEVHGAASAHALNIKPTMNNETVIPKERKQEESIEEPLIMPTLKPLEKKEEKPVQEISNELKQESAPLRAHSTELSLISEAEKSRQESLIEDSIRSTHKLSKHVIEKAMQSETIDASVVNAACNSVKQMHSLLRLRLDIHRELNKK